MFEQAGAVVLAVSPQDVDSHERFAEQEQLTFPLLADVAREIQHAIACGMKCGGVIESAAAPTCACATTRAALSEIMMAQGFQDLTGQLIKKVVTLDNLRVPFMTDGRFKIISFRSKDPVFKPDPGVIPDDEICAKAGITVVRTSFQHNDMRDTGSDEAKTTIQQTLDKMLDDAEEANPGAWLKARQAEVAR